MTTHTYTHTHTCNNTVMAEQQHAQYSTSQKLVGLLLVGFSCSMVTSSGAEFDHNWLALCRDRRLKAAGAVCPDTSLKLSSLMSACASRSTLTGSFCNGHNFLINYLQYLFKQPVSMTTGVNMHHYNRMCLDNPLIGINLKETPWSPSIKEQRDHDHAELQPTLRIIAQSCLN